MDTVETQPRGYPRAPLPSTYTQYHGSSGAPEETDHRCAEEREGQLPHKVTRPRTDVIPRRTTTPTIECTVLLFHLYSQQTRDCAYQHPQSYSQTCCTDRDSAGEVTITERSTKELRGHGTQTRPVYSWIAVPVLPSGTDAGPRTASSGARPDLPWVTRGRCGAARGPAVGSRVCQHGSVDRGVSAPVSAAGGGVAKFVRGRHAPSSPLCGVCRGHLVFSDQEK